LFLCSALVVTVKPLVGEGEREAAAAPWASGTALVWLFLNSDGNHTQVCLYFPNEIRNLTKTSHTFEILKLSIVGNVQITDCLFDFPFPSTIRTVFNSVLYLNHARVTLAKNQ
jgi:hypothetical protein